MGWRQNSASAAKTSHLGDSIATICFIDSENAATHRSACIETMASSPMFVEPRRSASSMQPAYSAFMSTGWWLLSGASVENCAMLTAPSHGRDPGRKTIRYGSHEARISAAEIAMECRPNALSQRPSPWFAEERSRSRATRVSRIESKTVRAETNIAALAGDGQDSI